MMHISEAVKIFEIPNDTVGKIPTAELKRQYRKLVKTWHPDVSGKDKQEAEMMMAKINEAYKLLTECVDDLKGSRLYTHEVVVPTYTHGANVFAVTQI